MSHDPLANRQQRDAERAKKKAAQDKPLNPPFPYVKQHFDALYFGLEQEPEPKKELPPPL